jgi:hypothetical protein
LLPADKEYHKDLAGIVRQAELGFYQDALKACAKASQSADLKESAVALHADILAALDAQVAELAETLKDTEAEGRFAAYLALQKIMKAMPREACGKAAKDACKAVAKDTVIKKELKAQKAFLNIMRQAAKMNTAQKRKVLKPALEKYIKSYAGTYYAREAQKEIAKL